METEEEKDILLDDRCRRCNRRTIKFQGQTVCVICDDDKINALIANHL